MSERKVVGLGQDSLFGWDGSAREQKRRGVLVTGRDLAVLRWVAEQYAVRVDVLAWLLGGERPLSPGRARQVAQRWARAGLALKGRFLAGQPSVVWPSREGLRVVLPGFRTRPPSLSMLAHVHAVSVVRLVLERRGVGAWVSERHLYRERAERDAHVPDGVYPDRDGASVAVEVELSVKGAERLARIVSDLSLAYPKVLYVAGDARVAAAVTQAAESIGERARVRIVFLSELSKEVGL